ncbi:MAG: hypothetical protein GY713_07800 [Actinomycetia bacterium]|nr:hypothetical protein [Actinomycetes bacterium]
MLGPARARVSASCHVRATASIDDLLDDVRSWLAENWAADLSVPEWGHRASAAGWLLPTWPEGLGGRGLTSAEGRAVSAEMVDAGTLGPPFSLGQVMGGPVVLQNGTPQQQARLVPSSR